MSTGALAATYLTPHSPTTQWGDCRITLDVGERGGEVEGIWRQVERVLHGGGLRRASLSKLAPNRVDAHQQGTAARVEVTPGQIVDEAEYHRRYSGIDLEYFRKNMPANRFEVFVRYLGLIPGSTDLDVTESSRLPE